MRMAGEGDREDGGRLWDAQGVHRDWEDGGGTWKPGISRGDWEETGTPRGSRREWEEGGGNWEYRGWIWDACGDREGNGCSEVQGQSRVDSEIEGGIGRSMEEIGPLRAIARNGRLREWIGPLGVIARVLGGWRRGVGRPETPMGGRGKRL